MKRFLWFVLLLFMIGCSSFNSDLQTAIQGDSIAMCDQFLEKYKNHDYAQKDSYELVVVRKAELMFNEAESKNTYLSYANFIRAFGYGNDVGVYKPDNVVKIRGFVNAAKEKAQQIRKNEIVSGDRKVSLMNWRDIHISLDSDFDDETIKHPPINVSQHVYTWDGKLESDFGDILIFRNFDNGPFAVEKNKLRTKAQISIGSRYIVIGAHVKNIDLENALGELIKVPVLSVPVVFDYEKDYYYKVID